MPAAALEYVPTVEMPDTGVGEAVSGACKTLGEARQNFWSNYNSGVSSVLNTAGDLPHIVQDLGSQTVQWVQEQTKTE